MLRLRLRSAADLTEETIDTAPRRLTATRGFAYAAFGLLERGEWTVSKSDASHALEISDLHFRHPASDDVAGDWTVNVSSLVLAKGEHLLLTGASGSGKSTLLQLVAGLLEPAQGTVRVIGTTVHSLRGAARDRFRGQHIGMIFQTFNLLHGFSAIENVMAAMMFSAVPAKEHRGRAGELLSRLGISDHHKPADRLSVGQQQRVAVARAIACAPNLVLADEPTASLDPENARAAVDIIREACASSGAALLCVSHDPALPERFERRVALQDLMGGMVASGEGR